MHFLRGQVLLELGRKEQAIRAFDVALKLQPQDPDILAKREEAFHSLTK
jgi:Flp pilus assembly protein TadD